MTNSPLLCPVCRDALCLEARTYHCANSHSFDLAKEGYVNLLLSHQRKSKNPGDDKAMIQARRRFFDSGAFDPVTKAIHHSTAHIPHPTILDCGCGEGHFLGALSASLRSGSVGDVAPPSDSELAGRASLSERAEQLFGIDISKEAIRCAAKRYKDVTWIVANGMRKLPLADHSMDCILSVLAPRNTEEFARVLKPEGQLILGVPGPNHLIELRTLLNASASDFEEKADEAAIKCAPLFAETAREAVSYEVALNKEQITDLIQMTPIFWNSAPDAKEKAQRLNELNITISFALLSLQPSGRVRRNP
ncbi:MAG: methyltransferase domain-containing protein [Kiritimatiellales bacterium]|nr:methyltransferase domain-containing protein [Kiritimatiellota bacterium]MBL7011380.1 methyltransferase domain-containing protein [Kiritimatiellales bacterium]